MNWKTIAYSALFIMLVVSIVMMTLAYQQPQITVQQASPDREYIRKYPVAGGGYEYILVREFRLNVEFEEEQ